MQLLGKLLGNHSVNLERALDRTSQRSSMLTRNLSNVNVPGYKREDMDFGIALDGEKGKPGDRLKELQRRSGINEGGSGAIRIDGNSVDLETEVMSITEMQVRYQLLAEMTSRHFSGIKNVIREGR